jgi:hypothetical protein
MIRIHHIPSRRSAAVGFAIMVWLISGNAYAQKAEAPPDLAMWGLHCFCITARHTPHAAVKADNNGRILWHARNGASAEDLRAAGALATESQILLMRTYGLLTEDRGRFTTAFPILGPDIMLPLRTRLRGLADRLAPKIAPEAKTIAFLLARAGDGGHSYAVVFGYALDGLLWDELRNRNALPDTTLDLDHPLWRGAFWAIYPERSGAPGTNEVALNGSTLVAVWTDRNVTALNDQLASAKGSPATVDLATGTTPVGRLPVVRNTPDDPIHAAAQRIAVITATALLDTSEGRGLLDSIPLATRSQAVVILAHELIWDIADTLVGAGSIVRPEALDADRPSARQLNPLMFLRVPR